MARRFSSFSGEQLSELQGRFVNWPHAVGLASGAMAVGWFGHGALGMRVRAQLRSDIQEVQEELHSDIQQVREELFKDRGERLKEKEAQLKEKFQEKEEQRMAHLEVKEELAELKKQLGSIMEILDNRRHKSSS